ncbi:MAG: NmrA family NAD(P)-binding protein [Almyronema sp.]
MAHLYPRILLIGVTGGTGSRAIKGFLAQYAPAQIQVMTRRRDLTRPLLQKLDQLGIGIVEADLDEADSLSAALTDISALYCHALSGDESKTDPSEVARGRRLATAAQQTGLQQIVYHSASGVERQSGVRRIEQKYQIEQILQQAAPSTTMLRACLFMEEFWKAYTRPAILRGKFPFSIPADKPLYLVSTKDLGQVAAAVMQNPAAYSGRHIELAADVLTPRQIAAAFGRVQGQTVVHQNIPAAWFLVLLRFELYQLIRWYRQEGCQADVASLRQEFPGLLTTFQQFLEETHWANPRLGYADLSFAANASVTSC